MTPLSRWALGAPGPAHLGVCGAIPTREGTSGGLRWDLRALALLPWTLKCVLRASVPSLPFITGTLFLRQTDRPLPAQSPGKGPWGPPSRARRSLGGSAGGAGGTSGAGGPAGVGGSRGGLVPSVCESGWRCCLINRDRKMPTDYIRNGVLYVTEK